MVGINFVLLGQVLSPKAVLLVALVSWIVTGLLDVMGVPRALSKVIYAFAALLLVKVIDMVSELLETAIPMSDVMFVPDPSAAVLAVMSVVAATVVHVPTPSAFPAAPGVGYRAIYVAVNPGSMLGELAPDSLNVHRSATLPVSCVITSVENTLKIWGRGSSWSILL